MFCCKGDAACVLSCKEDTVDDALSRKEVTGGVLFRKEDAGGVLSCKKKKTLAVFQVVKVLCAERKLCTRRELSKGKVRGIKDERDGVRGYDES